MYDLIIENARICDGTGKPSFYGSVAVKDGLIAAVHKTPTIGEATTGKINADGLVLAPGFIDPHTHYDANVASLAALTPLRHYVMGEESFERAATDDEVVAMQHLFRDAMRAGAFGLTS